MRSPLYIALACGLAVSALAVTGCGSGDDADTAQAGGRATGQYANVQNYLTNLTGRLDGSIATLSSQADDYYALIQEAGGCEAALKRNRAEVAKSVEGMQATWRKANPQYEKAEGIVAGVPSLAEYDVILDAGAAKKDDPENAVPFSVKYKNGTVLKQPGNFFFLTETSLWGTTPEFTCKGVKPDFDADGKVEFGEALPEPNHMQASATDMKKYTAELNASAKSWKPTEEDVFTAVVVMTPTMADYFDAWKNSRFVAGDKADEASFVGSSRLNDIADIIAGLLLVNESIEPQVAKENPDQAQQTTEDLKGLYSYVAKIRDQEAGGKQFTAEQADTYGSEAQGRAERIAGQVSQAAAQLGVNIQE